MTAIGCDACGGGLAMSPDGAYAVCERCGMKHDKLRIRQKAQEITGSIADPDPQQAELGHIRREIQKTLDSVPKIFRGPLLKGKERVGLGSLLFHELLELIAIVILDVVYACAGRPFLADHPPVMALGFRLFVLVLMLGFVWGMIRTALQFVSANRGAATLRRLREEEARLQDVLR